MKVYVRRFLALLLPPVGVAYLWYLATILNLGTTTTAVLGLLFWASQVHFVVWLGLYLFDQWRRHDNPAPPAVELHSADVFIVCESEDLVTLRPTLIACLRLDGEHETFLVDVCGRGELRSLAEEVGAVYYRSPAPRASRMQVVNELLGRTAGEFVAVLQPGVVPEQVYLTQTAGAFADPQLAAVQTAVLAQGRARQGLNGGVGVNDQDMLRRESQAGKTGWNSCTLEERGFVLRRRALDDVGGFVDETGWELKTSLTLHAKGWRIRYLDRPLCVDVRTVDVANDIRERARENASGFVAWLQSAPIFVARLSVAQRFSYAEILVACTADWARAALYLVPLVALALGVVPFVPESDRLATFYIASFAAATLFAVKLCSDGRHNVHASEVSAAARVWSSCWALLRAGFAGRRIPARPASPVRVEASLATAAPHALFVFAAALVLFWRGLGAAHGIGDGRWLTFAALWTVWHAGLAMRVLERVLASRERRRYERRAALLAVHYEVARPNGALLGLGLAADVSERGLGLIAYYPFSIGQTIYLTIDGPDGRVRCQGEVRTVRRWGDAAEPSLTKPVVYRIGVLLSRASTAQRDTLMRWSLMHVADEAKRSFLGESLRSVLPLANRRRRRRKVYHLPVILDHTSAEGESWAAVTHEIGPTGFRIVSRYPIDQSVEQRFIIATPYGPACGWCKPVRETQVGTQGVPLYEQVFQFTIWDRGANRIVDRLAYPSRAGVELGDWLTNRPRPRRLPAKAYALAAAVWFLFAAPVVGWWFLETRRTELFLMRLAAVDGPVSQADLARLDTMRTMELAPERCDVPTLRKMLDLYGRSGRRADAASLVLLIAERMPNDVGWQRARADALAEAGKRQEAEDAYARLLAARAGQGTSFVLGIHVARGRNLLAAGRPAEAEAQFALARRLDPNDDYLRRESAVALAASGRFDEGLALLEPQSPAPAEHRARMDVLLSAGRRNEAIAAGERLLELDPHNADAAEKLEELRRRRVAGERAVASFKSGPQTPWRGEFGSPILRGAQASARRVEVAPPPTQPTVVVARPKSTVRPPIAMVNAPASLVRQMNPKLPNWVESIANVERQARAFGTSVRNATVQTLVVWQRPDWRRTLETYRAWRAFDNSVRTDSVDRAVEHAARLLLALDSLGPSAESLRSEVRTALYRAAGAHAVDDADARRLLAALANETAERGGNAAETLAAADLAWGFQEWPLAGRLYAAASAQRPADRALRFRMAQAFEKAGDLERAAQTYRSLLGEPTPPAKSGVQTTSR